MPRKTKEERLRESIIYKRRQVRRRGWVAWPALVVSRLSEYLSVGIILIVILGWTNILGRDVDDTFVVYTNPEVAAAVKANHTIVSDDDWRDLETLPRLSLDDPVEFSALVRSPVWRIDGTEYQSSEVQTVFTRRYLAKPVVSNAYMVEYVETYVVAGEHNRYESVLSSSDDSVVLYWHEHQNPLLWWKVLLVIVGLLSTIVLTGWRSVSWVDLRIAWRALDQDLEKAKELGLSV